MRLPLILATFMVLLSIGYKAYFKGTPVTEKTVFSWGFILVLLAVLSNVEYTESIANIFIYTIILIIALNDGYDIVTTLTEG